MDNLPLLHALFIHIHRISPGSWHLLDDPGCSSLLLSWFCYILLPLFVMGSVGVQLLLWGRLFWKECLEREGGCPCLGTSHWGSTAGTLVAAVAGSGCFPEESEGQRACTDLEWAERGAGGMDRTACNSDNPEIVWKQGLVRRGMVGRESIAYKLLVFLFCLPMLLFHFSFIMLICIQMKYAILVILADIEEDVSF